MREKKLFRYIVKQDNEAGVTATALELELDEVSLQRLEGLAKAATRKWPGCAVAPLSCVLADGTKADVHHFPFNGGFKIVIEPPEGKDVAKAELHVGPEGPASFQSLQLTYRSGAVEMCYPRIPKDMVPSGYHPALMIGKVHEVLV